MKINIIKVGFTTEVDGEVSLIVDGELPPDSIVIFTDKESWEKIKQEMLK